MSDFLTALEQKRRQPQTGGFNCFGDVLEKLGREIARLKEAATETDYRDHAFNCIITANHLIDWAAADIIAEWNLSFVDNTMKTQNKRKIKKGITERMRKYFAEGRVINTIANSQKHAGRDSKNDDINTFLWTLTPGAAFGNVENIFKINNLMQFEVKILHDAEKCVDLLCLLERIFATWPIVYKEVLEDNILLNSMAGVTRGQ
ncbi:hypothetical protein [Roseicella frigidaeris]|uniref:hypothetical protein n=1 Tax=Roseicella frigidaeris TaxID=2230885 RepID=UPI000FDDD5FA|nr:hypothetical protein [Roseicella frigidaeris]